MSVGSVRRAQMIAPFGVGAMFTAKNGISVIGCGLDHWFERPSGNNDDVDVEEYKVEEWRLQRELKVDHFRLPPDHRKRNKYIPNQVNAELSVPYQRFPRYHYCLNCGHLEEIPLTKQGKVLCPECAGNGQSRSLVQVPFVTICDNGHIQDFPFREWVHRDKNTKCTQKMKLKSSGGASLAAQVVSCSCGVPPRNLMGITQSFKESTYLSRSLQEGEEFTCNGKRPWLHDSEGEGCGRPLRGALRNAANVYFPQVRSSIYLPKGAAVVPDELMEILNESILKTVMKQLSAAGIEIVPDTLREIRALPLKKYSDEQIKAAINVHLGKDVGTADGISPRLPYDDDETAFRREEFDLLCSGWKDKYLHVIKQDEAQYDPDVRRFFSQIMLVPELRETRVLTGFNRIYPENALSQQERASLLRKKQPDNAKENWLPAYVTFGEGIFIRFNEEQLQKWEMRDDVISRAAPLIGHYNKVAEARRYKQRILSPRLLLLHTFAHLMINRLTFECGYSSASLRERLYVSNHADGPMAGVMIYTAAGDSEGTMGGLVRLGKAGNLEPVIRRALEGASWCSADPVCMEMGEKGQGPDSCNLAACHSCALLPETACEEFNRFLDRGVLIGSHNGSVKGYFSDLVVK